MQGGFHTWRRTVQDVTHNLSCLSTIFDPKRPRIAWVILMTLRLMMFYIEMVADLYAYKRRNQCKIYQKKKMIVSMTGLNCIFVEWLFYCNTFWMDMNGKKEEVHQNVSQICFEFNCATSVISDEFISFFFFFVLQMSSRCRNSQHTLIQRSRKEEEKRQKLSR